MFSEIELFRAKKAIRDLAKQNGVSEDKIREEMAAAIDAGFTNPDPSVKAIWKRSPFTESRPSPEEFILWCMRQIDCQG